MQMYNYQPSMAQSDYAPYMQMTCMPDTMYPTMTMPDQQLESMYPRIYNIVYPVVMQCCQEMDTGMYPITRENLESMVDRVEGMTSNDAEMTVGMGEQEESRQFGFGGRRLFRDLIAILLLRQLLGRRRFGYGYPGYGYGGYGYGGYGYPGYGFGFGGY